MSIPSLKTICIYPIDFCRSTLSIARLCCQSSDQMSDYVVTVPTPKCSPTRLYLVANLLSYTPGTLVVGTSDDGDLLVHVVTDADRDRASLEKQLREFVEAWT